MAAIVVVFIVLSVWWFIDNHCIDLFSFVSFIFRIFIIIILWLSYLKNLLSTSRIPFSSQTLKSKHYRVGKILSFSFAVHTDIVTN